MQEQHVKLRVALKVRVALVHIVFENFVEIITAHNINNTIQKIVRIILKMFLKALKHFF